LNNIVPIMREPLNVMVRKLNIVAHARALMLVEESLAFGEEIGVNGVKLWSHNYWHGVKC
jgi:hypothetical protein